MSVRARLDRSATASLYFCRRGIALVAAACIFYTSACGRGAGGHVGKSSHNSGSGARTAARCGPVGRRRRRSCEDHLCLGGVGLRFAAAFGCYRALQDASELAVFSAHATRLARLQPRSRAGTIVPQKNCRSELTAVRSCARAPSSQEANQRRLLFPRIRARRGATKHARTVRDSSAKRASSARRAATTETVRGA